MDVSDVNPDVVEVVELEIEELYQLEFELLDLCAIQFSFDSWHVVLEAHHCTVQTFTTHFQKRLWRNFFFSDALRVPVVINFFNPSVDLPQSTVALWYK